MVFFVYDFWCYQFDYSIYSVYQITILGGLFKSESALMPYLFKQFHFEIMDSVEAVGKEMRCAINNHRYNVDTFKKVLAYVKSTTIKRCTEARSFN